MYSKNLNLNSLSVRICGTYLILYYLIPLFIGYFYDYSYLEFYKGSPEFLYVLPAVIIYFIVFYIINQYTPNINTPLRRIHIRTFSRPYLNLLITLLFLYLSSKFYSEYGLSYRQTGASISESSGYIIILLILKVYFSIFIFCKLADFSFNLKPHKIEILTLLIGSFSFFLSGSAAFDMLKILFIFLLLIAFFFNINFLIVNNSETSVFKLFFKRFFQILGMVIGFVIVLFFGLSNKIGYESAYELIFDGTLFEFIVIPLSRLSVHFYTLSYHLNYSILNLNYQLEMLPSVIENLIFRFSELFGFDFQKPELPSSARLNSLTIYYNPSSRNGATPGLMGSIFFIPIFPLSMFISIFYVSFILRKMEEIFNEKRKASIISIVFMVSVIQVFTDAQIDLINFIGISGISLFFLYFAWFDRPYFRVMCKDKSPS